MDFSIRLKPKTIFIILFVFSCCLLTTAGASIGGTYYYIDNNFNVEDKNVQKEGQAKIEEDTKENAADEDTKSSDDIPVAKNTDYENSKYLYRITLTEGFRALEPVGADSATSPNEASASSKIVLITHEENSSLNFVISIKDYGSFESREELFGKAMSSKNEKNCYREDETASINSISNVKIVDEFLNCDNNKQNRFYYIFNENTGRGIEIAAFYSKGFTLDIDEMLATLELL